jgi:signal transduction histidine kinase
MNGNRWWHLLFALTMVVLAGMFVANAAGGQPREWLALTMVGVITVAYVAVGRHGFVSRRAALVFLSVLLLGSGVATAVDPNMAVVQCIAMPLIWYQLDVTRHAIIGNAAFVVAIALGMMDFFDFGPQGVLQSALVEGISLVGSICLGLWITRIAELSDERRRLLDELRSAQAAVAALSHEAGATSERERLARDLHDTIAQSLTGLVLLGQRASRELASGDAADAASTLAMIEETARDTLVETRSLVASGAPVDLDAGLPAALHRLGRRFERETGVAVAVSGGAGVASGAAPAHPDPGSALGSTGAALGSTGAALESAGVELDSAAAALGRDLEVVLLRTAQEALANVRKHSGASRARVELRVVGSEASLTVADDGCGFDAGAAADGFGLAGLRARLELAGGRLSVDSGAGRGTCLTAVVPVGGGGVGVGAAASPATASAPAPASAPAASASSGVRR